MPGIRHRNVVIWITIMAICMLLTMQVQQFVSSTQVQEMKILQKIFLILILQVFVSVLMVTAINW